MLLRTTQRVGLRLGLSCRARSSYVLCRRAFFQSSPSCTAAGTGQDEGRERRQKTGGSYIRILGVLAASGALGWSLRAWNDDGPGSKVAKPADFVKYTLDSRQDISSTSAIFTLKASSGTTIDIQQLRDQHAITSVQFKQPELQIARSYTVLPALEGQSPDDLRFLIRKEQKGEVSGYLYRLPIGSEIEVRGPSVDCVLPENVDEVLFLAGGTGIAPAVQLADKLVGKAEVFVLWANRRREDCVVGGLSEDQPTMTTRSWTNWLRGTAAASSKFETLPTTTMDPSKLVVAQLLDLTRLQSVTKKGGQSFGVDHYADDAGSFIRPAHVAKLLARDPNDQSTRFIIVSGPEGFVNYWAGPKQWVGGREVQGPIGGVLSRLDTQGWHVIKL